MDKLRVLECDYVYNAWRVEKKNEEYKIISEIKEHKNRKATDDFNLCGVYGKAGIPFEIEKIKRNKYPHLEPYQAIPLAFSDAVYDGIRNGERILCSSGYCVYAPAVVGGIQRAIGLEKKIGVIWIDAHFDNVIVENTTRDSVTFVGIPLSTIMGQTMDSWRKDFCKLEKPCKSINILVSDGRLSDNECISNIINTDAVVIDAKGFDNSDIWEQKIYEFANTVDVIYLMVDADILSPEFIPSYFEEEPGGHTIDTVMKNIQTVMNTDKVVAFSTFCIDFDKYEKGGDITYLNGMRMIAAGLESWKKC